MISYVIIVSQLLIDRIFNHFVNIPKDYYNYVSATTANHRLFVYFSVTILYDKLYYLNATLPNDKLF